MPHQTVPHRVTSFFRNSTNSLENQVINLKKSTIRSRTKSPHRPALTNRVSSSERVVSTYASSIDEDIDDSMADSPNLQPRDGQHHNKDHKDHKGHRISFLHLPGRSSKETHANPHASLSWKVESPPIILHGDAENSSGALVSGQLLLDIKEDTYDVNTLKATLNIHVTQKKPFTAHCAECMNQFTSLKEWSFLQEPLAMNRGVHTFPFSILLDGHLPATLDGPLVAIAYEFKVEATPKVGIPITLNKIFDVKRALPPPEIPHHSVRVFPPTNVKASVHYKQVIHPIGTNKLEMRLDGIARTNSAANTTEYWKLKKITWRLEETAKTVAPACDKHAPKPEGQRPATPEGTTNPKKGVARSETRIIGEKTLFSGWKSSYAGATDSTIEVEMDYGLKKDAKFSCDTKSRDGSEVTHQLMLEMIVSQESAPVGKPALVTQTGVARILRMHFGTVLTERGGIGISWDNESPPIYQDVPPSPPAYCEDVLKRGTVINIPNDVGMLLDDQPLPETPPPFEEVEGTGSGASGRSSAEGRP